jgi:hypothetical protein
MKAKAVRMTVRVDGSVWFKARPARPSSATSGTVARGIAVFPDASTSDGLLEVGVVTASSVWQWCACCLGGTRPPERSPFVEMTRGKKIEIELGRRHQLRARWQRAAAAKRLKVRAKADAITVCVRHPEQRRCFARSVERRGARPLASGASRRRRSVSVNLTSRPPRNQISERGGRERSRGARSYNADGAILWRGPDIASL